MKSLVREEMRTFISKRTLGEFLANASQARPASPAGTAVATGTPGQFVTRDQITDLFYQIFNEKADQFGVELRWIGVGTWETPSEIVPDQHREAWQLSRENQRLGNPKALKGVRKDSRKEELIFSIREVPIATFAFLQARDLDHQQVKRDLARAFHQRLQSAWRLYQENGSPPPEELEQVLRHLIKLIAHFP
jgi:hypothetical protein